jgi:hypothetical protein
MPFNHVVLLARCWAWFLDVLGMWLPIHNYMWQEASAHLGREQNFRDYV